jgi:hypothetical protein
MNSITEHHRLKAYRNAHEDVRDLYASDKLVEYIDRLILLFEIKLLYRDVSEIIADHILGFYKDTELPELFQKKLALDAEQSNRMFLEVKKFLSLNLKLDTGDTPTKKQELAKLAEQFAQPRVVAPVVMQPSENGTEDVTPLRTMQGDMNRIHGYGAYNEALERGEDATQAHVSSQTDILKKGE